ncbi:MAG: ORF6N domain-containing protein [Treponema sp.]|nr:ORF6N domain-containing protein [Treponema sp.]
MTHDVITSVLIESKFFLIRGKQVMIDRDLAELYGVETKVINQAVKRNLERFPEEFRFQLTEDEMDELVTNCDRFNVLKHSSALPYVFTEQGVAMLSAVLRSETAVQVSIRIMNAFVQLRHFVSEQVVKTDDKTELAEIRRLLLLHIDHCDKKFSEQDRKISQIIQVLNNLLEEPKSERKIGFREEA